jgi:hypothetical protein
MRNDLVDSLVTFDRFSQVIVILNAVKDPLLCRASPDADSSAARQHDTDMKAGEGSSHSH